MSITSVQLSLCDVAVGNEVVEVGGQSCGVVISGRSRN